MAGFITRWTVAGGAPERTITLPLFNSGVFNCVVSWGDATADSTITTFDDADRIHTYAADGTYDVTITGECPSWSFNNAGDKLKIVSIVNWGDAGDFGGFGYLTTGFFGCTNLTSLGTGKIQAKAGLTNLYRCFRGCTALSSSIPSGFFDNCINLTALAFHETFHSCAITGSIPIGLFDYNVNVTTFAFYSTFFNCTELTGDIPSGLFNNCPNASTDAFSYTFYFCSKLEGTPAHLFRDNPLVENFSYCFVACNKLQLNKNIFYAEGEQSTRFINKTVNFFQAFFRTSFTGVQGEAPDLWNCNFGTGSANPTSCFAGAGNSATSLSNYSEIPTTWGGPYGGLGYWTDRRDILQGLREEGVLRLYHDYRSGRTADRSDQGNNGTASAGSVWTKRGGRFLATTDEITVADAASLRIGSGSIVVLGDFVSQIASEGLVGRSNGATCQFWFYSNATSLAFNDNANIRTLAATVNGKKCLAISWTSGGTPIGFADGISLGNFSGVSTPSVAAGTVLEIGNIQNTNKNQSQIKAVVVLSRALTASEHSALYAQLENMVWPTKGLFPGAFMP